MAADRSLADWLGEPQAETTDDATDPLGPPPETDEELWDEDPPRRTSRLWLIAVVPWLVVGVGLIALRGGGPDPGAPEPAALSGETAPSAAADGPDLEVSDAPGGDEHAPDGMAGAQAPVSPRPGPSTAAPGASAGAAADALALAAVQLAVTGSDEDGRERYVELAAVERRTQLAADTLVVTVLAVVLDGSEGAWTGRRPARYAVPVRDVGDAPVLLGAPWPLPAPALEAAARPDGEPGDDLADAVVAALEAAGFEQIEVGGVERLGGALLRAAVTAVPPDESIPRALEPWLTADPTPRVLGLAPGAAPTAEPVESASEEDEP